MQLSKQQASSYQECKRFLSRSYKSKEEFVREYRKLYYGKPNAEELYLLILTELKKATVESNIDRLQNLSKLIAYITEIEDYISLRDYYNHSNNSIKNTNLVILACKHNKIKILDYLFSNDSQILNNLSIDLRKATILPTDVDDAGHNTFYYAIRSGNIELLEILINKWPDKYFAVRLGELDEVLSRAYEELKLKNVLLSEEMDFFVENKLINLRFFSDTPGTVQNIKSNVNNIKERIELVLENISILTIEYRDTKRVDKRFLFILRFIAQNIHVLKRQLKSTYSRLPWEEIEFCLISFVSSQIKRQEMNMFYNATLNKGKILNHLENFAENLKNEKDRIENTDISKLFCLPILKREEVVADIINNYPEFEQLYNDYQQIRDICSLMKINEYIQLAFSANPKQKEGQLIIIRVLQVIGEYLKNTLESPKLSNITSELLLLSLSKNTREIIKDLRNSLSHAYSLSQRTEIEENTDSNFFSGIQNDTKKIGDVITDIIYSNKIKMIILLLEKIIDTKDLDGLKEIAEVFSNIEFQQIFKNIKMMGHEKLEKLITELSNNISDKTNYEKKLFNKINNIISSTKTKSENTQMDYSMGFLSLKAISEQMIDNKIDHNIIRGLKFQANKTLQNIAPQIEPNRLKEIAELSMKISHSIKSTIQQDNLDKVDRLITEIFYIVQFEANDIKWIEELREKLNKKYYSISTQQQKQTYNLTKEKYKNQLSLKLSELKSILRNNSLSDKLINKLPVYKSNKKLQAVVEMLVLDIMSLLNSSKKYLENNLLFLDDNTPLLIGKCLRNHLAHNNALLDILLSDPSMTVILNAMKLTSENIMKNKKKIGKFVQDDPSKLQEQYVQSLITITNQEKMFVALEEGNLEDLKSSLKEGADIRARNDHLWTALHFAAKGPSLEVVRFILDESSVSAKDINGRTPLHIAAAHGRKNIVEFLTKQANLSIDDQDNSGKSPLHIAAQNGHRDTVDLLLKNNANTNNHDTLLGFSPLHYAIRNNHIDVAKILLKKEVDVDINEAMSGFTSLHIAAEKGHLELVNFLLKKEANVNAKTDRGAIPLHTAALNGHLEVVKTLILNGANVNSRVLDGCTPLHYAIENGHEDIANILLKHGANTDTFDKTYYNTPLHYAAKDGHERIVKLLLKNKANANVATIEGLTPLHFAAQSGHLEIVTDLLKYGVSIHAKDKTHSTPLHYAAAMGHKEVAEHLIKNRAEVNVKSIDNTTPLHAAAEKGNIEVTDLLIKNNAEVNVQDMVGRTPLHVASMNGNKDIIDILIKNKAQVNVKSIDGITPLYAAVMNGHKESVDFLIKQKAEVNTVAQYSFTPLHAAIIGGHKDIVNLLIKNKADLNITHIANITPLDIAVEAGHKEIVEILIANGANVNVGRNKQTPLFTAIKYNNTEIVQVLIENGANVNADNSEALTIAALFGYSDIVEILLRNNVNVNNKGKEDVTPLHLAATIGHRKIVNALVKRGADVHSVSINNVTPLLLAAKGGHEEVIEILIENGATVNVKAVDGITPLHIAAKYGYYNAVRVLLDNNANVSIKDNKNRTPLELAVLDGHLQVVKMLLQCKKIDMDTKGNDDWTILHVASQGSNLEIVKYLVDEGSDIHARNASGSKPIHIAAREGNKQTVEFFLSQGSSINDCGAVNQTLLHYAAMKGHLDVVEYLIAQGADTNVKDVNGETPLHIAATFGFKNVIEVLLQNGAFYNDLNNLYKKPLEKAKDKSVINLLSSTEKLFEAVKRNSYSEIESIIKAGAFVNAKNVDSGTALHYAAWKGYEEVVNVLLQNKANPNIVGNKRLTPLHYAAKFSHLNIVKALLSSGAVYNAVSDGGKTPSDFTADKSVTNIFKLLSDSFRNIKNGNAKVINDLNKIKDVDIIKAIMGARDTDNKTLVVAAIHSNFSKVEQLKQICQGDISNQISTAERLLLQGNYQKALSIFTSAFEKRIKILGPDNPGTLDIQTCIAKTLYKQGAYQQALNMFSEILDKQKAMLGLNDKDTLNTRSGIALVFHRQGKDEEALDIFQDVYQKQKEVLGSNDSETLATQFHMALVLDRLKKYDEALSINRTVFEQRKVTLGPYNPLTISAENNIAMVLSNQQKHEEALKIYKEVFDKKKMILGPNHSDTLRTIHNIAGILMRQKKYTESLKAYQEVLKIQKTVLGPNHPDTLNTQYNIGNMFFAQGKWINALKAYKECFNQKEAVLGSWHPAIADISIKIHAINLRFKLEGSGASEILQHLQKEINIAASNGDKQTVLRLLKDGADANDTDVDGRTPLHFAVSNGHISIVNILLKNGADVTHATNKGNTPLHTAVSKRHKEIVEVLLQHVNRNKLNDFINAKTLSGGTTSLHVAAKSGFLEIVKSLLMHGATYNIENKEGKTPNELSKDQNVTNLLKLVAELYEHAKKGNVEIINKLQTIKSDECVAIINARNNQGNTLLQVAIANKHKNIASKLLAILKKPDQNV